jgi:hypothetical protein
MSRSRKKAPIRGITTATTEKNNKREANRKFRRKIKMQLKRGDTHFPLLREVSNIWSFDKDGKYFLKKATKKDLRK